MLTTCSKFTILVGIGIATSWADINNREAGKRMTDLVHGFYLVLRSIGNRTLQKHQGSVLSHLQQQVVQW